MGYHIPLVAVFVLASVGQTLTMSTCSKETGDLFRDNEELEGSFLPDLATNEYWAAFGVEPDKTGFTSIYLRFGDIQCNENQERYLILTIQRKYSNETTRTFDVQWTQHGEDKFFDAKYPDGQYNIYHLFHQGLIGFHRCSVDLIENGNVSFTAFAPIDKKKDEIKETVIELKESLKRKFPNANVIDLDYPISNICP